MPEDLHPRRGQFRGPAWTRVSHGLYRPSHELSGPRQDLEAWRLVLPERGAFTHLTAAREYGWWLPPLPADLPVHASIGQGESRPRRPGLRISRHDPPVATLVVDGLPLAVPTEVLLACGRDLGLLDMVVLVDAALHAMACTPDDVWHAARFRRRGAPMLRRALRLADAHSESAWESMLRMLHWACDVPVEPQFEVYDEHGRFVARADLRIRGTRTLHEYDGGDHLTRQQQRKDLRRLRELGHADWTRRGYTAYEVLRQPTGILRDADASLGRPHRPERIRAWNGLLAGSLFTPSGTAQLRRRCGLAEEPPETGHQRPADSA